MPERQLGEVPERCGEEVVDTHGHFDACGEPATGHAIHEDYAVYPACDKHRWAPVADAVRAERKRVERVLKRELNGDDYDPVERGIRFALSVVTAEED